VIIVDTNVVVYFLIRGEFTREAETVRSKDDQWFVPPLFRHEFLNVLCTYFRKGELQRDDALRTYRRGMSLITQLTEDHDPRRVFRLVEESGCSSYDAEFVAVAIEENVQLVTADAKILAAFPGVAANLDEFTRSAN